MNWLHYLLEANIYLAIFYAGYCIFLNKETYYTLNRIYLLLSCIISFLLPLVQVGMLKPVDQGVVSRVFIAPIGLKPTIDQATSFSISLQDIVIYAYFLGVIVLVTILTFKLYKLAQMTRTANRIAADKYKIVPIEDSNTAFSFFNYLFIGSKLKGTDIIIRHEMVHIRQKHTLDVLFLEFIKIINWFNPFVYLLQNSLKTVHEYIADEQTAAFERDTLAYSSFLVNNAYGLNGSSVTHSFFNYNLLKKRIIMLNQKRSGNLARLKYLVAVPICAAALCASTLGFSKTYALVDLAPQRNVADSSAKVKQSKIQYLPPPIMVKNGYDDLFTHLNKTEKYPKAELKNKQPGLVIVAFNVGTDHKISNTQIAKSTGNAFSEVVLASFRSFNGSVNDKAGEHKLAITFFTDYYGQAPKYEADIQKSGAEFNTFVIGSLGYTVPPPPPPRPSSGSTPPAVKKPTYISKQKTPPPPPPVPPAPTAETPKVSVVKFPLPKKIKAAPKTQVVKFPPPIIKAPVEKRPPPPPPENPFAVLSTYLAKTIRYPAVARNNQVTGDITIKFRLNNNHQIEDIIVSKGIGSGCDEEVVRALKSYTGTIENVTPNTYNIVIAYRLDGITTEDQNAGKDFSSVARVVVTGYKN